MSFNHLSKLSVPSDKTATFTFYDVVGRPSLTVRPAASTNKGYYNALFKSKSALVRRLQRTSRLTPEMAAEGRDQDRSLFPRHVVTGWSGVRDDEGKDVAFCHEACEEFLRALPDDIFDELRNFASDLSNFRSDDELSETDLEEVSGN